MTEKKLQFKKIKDLAYTSIKKKDYQKGKELLEKAILIEPNNAEALNDLGLLDFNLNNLDKSIDYFKKAISINPNFSLAINNLGNVFLKKKDFANAMQSYNQAIKIDSKNVYAHYNLGLLHYKKSEIKQAEKFFNLTINLISNFRAAYINLFELYDKSNQVEKFHELLKKAEKVFSNDSMINFFVGIYQFKKKKYYEVIKTLENIKFDDQADYKYSSVKYELLAKSFDFIGSHNKAYEYFEKSNKIIDDFGKKKKIDKNIFRDLIKKRIEYFIKSDFENWNNINFSDKRNDPIFIIGFPRSGTTLLDTILRSHPSIEVIEEEPIIDEFIKHLEKKINYNFKNLENISEDFIEEMRNFYFNERNKFIKDTKNKFVYIDKMPLNIIHVGEFLRFFPKSKFIFALRHPYDSVLSCFMQNFTPNNAMINFTNINDSCYLYDLVMQLWIKYRNSFSLNVHTIKYEDVVNNFDESISDLLKFLKLKWSDDVRKFYKTAEKRNIINTPSYNQVNTPLYKKSINRWKNYENKFSGSKEILDKWVKIFNYEI